MAGASGVTGVTPPTGRGQETVKMVNTPGVSCPPGVADVCNEYINIFHCYLLIKRVSMMRNLKKRMRKRTSV